VSAKYNLVCEQATTFEFQFQIKNDTTPWNLTNYSVEMTVRPFMGATTTTVVASTDNGYITLDPTQGRVTVNIPYGITEDFVPSPGTEITRILEGTFVVTQAVTLP